MDESNTMQAVPGMKTQRGGRLMNDVLGLLEVESRVLILREQQVLIDRDVAELYGVGTKEVNQAVRNNPEKFPEGYVFTLSSEEKSELVKNFDQFNPLKHSSSMPSAFTEKGLYMLATILKSSSAAQTTIAIVETFSKIRELVSVVRKLPEVEEENKQKALMKRSSEILSDVLGDGTLQVSENETTIEVNLAVMKIKHTIKREKKEGGAHC